MGYAESINPIISTNIVPYVVKNLLIFHSSIISPPLTKSIAPAYHRTATKYEQKKICGDFPKRISWETPHFLLPWWCFIVDGENDFSKPK